MTRSAGFALVCRQPDLWTSRRRYTPAGKANAYWPFRSVTVQRSNAPALHVPLPAGLFRMPSPLASMKIVQPSRVASLLSRRPLPLASLNFLPVMKPAGVCVGVEVGDTVRVGVNVAVRVTVRVAVDVTVRVGVGVRVAVRVAVGVGVAVGVWVGEGVGVEMGGGLRVGVKVGIRVGEGVGRCVEVDVGGGVTGEVVGDGGRGVDVGSTGASHNLVAVQKKGTPSTLPLASMISVPIPPSPS